MIIKKILDRLLFLVQLILVVIFIVFEEVIWEGISKPIYEYIHDLHLLQTLKRKLSRVNRYIVLVVFVVLLVGVEGAGLAAGVMAVKGMVLAATLLYALKIPIAAFTFWLFRVTETKLRSFDWFNWSYEKVMAFFAWVKSTDIYKSTIEMMRRAKTAIKELKVRYFSGDNTIAKRFRRLYKAIKLKIRK